PTGVFYEQFGITLIVAIAISAVNALTLSPALCALFLKPIKEKEEKKKIFLQRFYNGFNTAFAVTTDRYVKSLQFMYRKKWIPVVMLLLCVVAVLWAEKTTPTGFVPNEDRGIIFTDV